MMVLNIQNLLLIYSIEYRIYHKYTDFNVKIHHKDDKKLAYADLKTEVEVLNKR
jgi:hypothetical protein